MNLVVVAPALSGSDLTRIAVLDEYASVRELESVQAWGAEDIVNLVTNRLMRCADKQVIVYVFLGGVGEAVRAMLRERGVRVAAE